MAETKPTKKALFDKDKSCAIAGCAGSVFARGWCQSHYRRWREYGDPHKVGKRWNDPAYYFEQHVVRGESPDDCWGWKRPLGSSGYARLSLHGKNIAAHRVSLFIHTGIWPDGLVIHSCDNPPCTNPRHLRVGTHADNMRDRTERGRCPQHRRKLTEEQVLAIAQDSRSYSVLARLYGVGTSAIGRIKTGESWSWLTGIKRI